MRRSVLVLFALACATTASAQSLITTTRQSRSTEGVFEIGPRVSNYSTDVREQITPLRTGRQSSFGLVGNYRNGSFMLDFLFDHDPENGISISSLIVDTGNYSRNHGEVAVGFAPAPWIDLLGGVRIDETRIGGVVILGNPVSTDLSIDHQALTAGIRFHSGARPIGFFVQGRGFIGSAKLDFGEGDVDTDSSGYRGEAGLKIGIGDSAWTAQPGFEYDHFETKSRGVRMNTNRFFLNFVYRSR